MASNTVVLDASVVVKWFHEEPDTPLAEHLEERIARGDLRAIVPPLLFYEVANVLTLKAGSRPAEIIDAHRVLVGLPLQVVEVIHGVLADAIVLAHNHHISVYDAVYVALAAAFRVQLITADKKLLTAVQSPSIQLLSEFH